MAQCPFDKNTELNESAIEQGRDHLPGYPCIQLRHSKKLLSFLEQNLFSPDLEQIADKLWWMSKQDSKNISPLHRQYVKSRRIILTEDPKLHLIWIQDRIFIKPLPEYLLSHSFWTQYLLPSQCDDSDDSDLVAQRDRVRKAALGLLRTYFYLVQHASDFRIAQSPALELIPPRVTWEGFCAFSARFDAIRDDEVSWRYAYGEIRLTRLNFYSKFLTGKWYFHRLMPQYEEYFARFYAPMLYLFGFLSVILSAMQVEMSVEQLDSATPWFAFQRLSRVFTVLSLVAVLAVTVWLIGLFLLKFAKEWKYALADRFVHRRHIHESHKLRDKEGRVEADMGSDKPPV